LSSKILVRGGRYVNNNTFFAGFPAAFLIDYFYTFAGRGLRYLKKRKAESKKPIILA